MPMIASISTITALYAGILGLILMGIIFIVFRIRGSTDIWVGDGGNLDVIAAMRRHSNFVESVPLALILIALLEMNGVAGRAIHCLGAGLVLARLSHAFGYRANNAEKSNADKAVFRAFRGIGAVSSSLIIIVTSV